MILSQDGRLDSNDNGGHEVSLKPKTSSMIFKPKTPSSLPNSAKPLTNNQNILDPVPSLLPSGPALPPASPTVRPAPCPAQWVLWTQLPPSSLPDYQHTLPEWRNIRLFQTYFTISKIL